MSCRVLTTLTAVLLFAHASQAAEPDITLRKVSYKELGKIVRDYKGKVVVVDFWSTTCIPCMRAFPHLVKMHQRYKDQGFAAVSVSVDEPTAEQAALAFLQEQKATFTNVFLNEKPEVWQKNLKSEGVPIVFVFNRQGKIEQKFTEAPKDEELDKLVERLLKEK